MRTKGGVSAKRFKSDDAFKESRKASNDFGTACRAAGLLRKALMIHHYQTGDRRLISRLTKALYDVIKLDPEHPKGHRRIQPNHLSALHDFQFDINHPIAEKAVSLVHTTGDYRLTLNPLVLPTRHKSFKVILIKACIDFQLNLSRTLLYESAGIGKNTKEIILSFPMDKEGELSTTNEMITFYGVHLLSEAINTEGDSEYQGMCGRFTHLNEHTATK